MGQLYLCGDGRYQDFEDKVDAEVKSFSPGEQNWRQWNSGENGEGTNTGDKKSSRPGVCIWATEQAKNGNGWLITSVKNRSNDWGKKGTRGAEDKSKLRNETQRQH